MCEVRSKEKRPRTKRKKSTVVSSKKKWTEMNPIRRQNEKMQPIHWTERPTGALVAAGSLWPDMGSYKMTSRDLSGNPPTCFCCYLPTLNFKSTSCRLKYASVECAPSNENREFSSRSSDKVPFTMYHHVPADSHYALQHRNVTTLQNPLPSSLQGEL